MKEYFFKEFILLVFHLTLIKGKMCLKKEKLFFFVLERVNRLPLFGAKAVDYLGEFFGFLFFFAKLNRGHGDLGLHAQKLPVALVELLRHNIFFFLRLGGYFPEVAQYGVALGFHLREPFFKVVFLGKDIFFKLVFNTRDFIFPGFDGGRH